MKITFKQLNLFVAIANSGSLSHGAKEVFLTQPAASVALRELENRLGQPLFDRMAKKLVLNENGLQLYPKAVELIERLNHVEQLFDHKHLEPSGTLKIGASMTIGNYVTPRLIANFMRSYPKVHIIQKVANSETIINDLEKFQCDIGLIESECFSETLHTKKWGEDELVIFAAEKNPLSKLKIITVKELEQASWVLREPGSGTRTIMEKYIHPKNIRLEINSTQAIKKIVMASHSVACASRYTIEEELRAKTLVKLKIKNGIMKRNFLQVIHKEKYQTELIKLFLKEFLLIA